MVVFSSVPPQYYEDYKSHLEQKGCLKAGVFLPLSVMQKQSQRKNEAHQQKILNAPIDPPIPYPNKLTLKEDLKFFL